MSDLADRTLDTSRVDTSHVDTHFETPASSPPGRHPPTRFHAAAPWPPAAKALVAVLAVAALLGAAGGIASLTRTDDDRSAVEQQYRTEIDQLIAERDAALVDLADLDATLASVTDQGTDLTGQVNTLRAQIAALTGRTTELTSMIDRLQTERDDAVVAKNVLTGELAAQIERTETAAAERDALADLFPISFDASLDDAAMIDLVGTYDIEYDEAYCVGFATCGTPPAVDRATITRTPEGYLTLTMPGFMTGGLYRIDGALYTTVDSDTAIDACGTTPRTARVSVMLYAHGVTVADDGSQQIDDLGANIGVEAPATGSCPAGMAFYGAELTPRF